MAQSNSFAESITFLKTISSSDASDALVALGHSHGGYLHGINLLSVSPQPSGERSRICGPVTTVKLVPASDKTSPIYEGLYADAVENGKVVFISQPRGTINAVWGELMSARAHTLGAFGVVADGQIRDIKEQGELGLPIFARGTSPIPAKGQTRCAGVNVPTDFQSALGVITIHPDDYIIGDHDGVVLIANSLVSDVAHMARKSIDGDQQALRAIMHGSSAVEAFRTFRGR